MEMKKYIIHHNHSFNAVFYQKTVKIYMKTTKKPFLRIVNQTNDGMKYFGMTSVIGWMALIWRGVNVLLITTYLLVKDVLWYKD